MKSRCYMVLSSVFRPCFRAFESHEVFKREAFRVFTSSIPLANQCELAGDPLVGISKHCLCQTLH